MCDVTYALARKGESSALLNDADQTQLLSQG